MSITRVVGLSMLVACTSFLSSPNAAHAADCNSNGIEDATDIAEGTSGDCNSNGIVDECDLMAGTSSDCNGNLMPDECDLYGPLVGGFSASDGESGDGFGGSVDMDGDTAVVGAYEAGVAGAVYVFRYVQGEWVEEAKLVPADMQRVIWFGLAVAIEGDVIAVYARETDDEGETYYSVVYMFRRAEGGWTLEGKIVDPILSTFNHFSSFGRQLVFFRGKLITLGFSHDCQTSVSGVIHVFRHTVSGWIQENVLCIERPHDDKDGDRGGTVTHLTVGADDRTIAVASMIVFPNGGMLQDYTYVFRFQSDGEDGVWLPEARIAMSSPFGMDMSAAVSGDVVAVGMDVYGGGDMTHILRRLPAAGGAGGVWVEDASVIGGSAIAMDRDVLVTLEIGSVDLPDSVRFFRSSSTGPERWKSVGVIPLPGDVRLSGLGAACQGLTAIVGVPYGDGTQEESGTVLTYTLVDDCNSNGVPDDCEIADGGAWDCNSNGRIDACDAADWNVDGVGLVDDGDFAVLFECLTGPCFDDVCDPPLYADLCCELADLDGDGDVDLDDYELLQQVAAGAVERDCNANGVPDREETPVGDFNGDGVTDADDYGWLSLCVTGVCTAPSCDPPLYGDYCCALADADTDGDIDLVDFAAFQRWFSAGN